MKEQITTLCFSIMLTIIIILGYINVYHSKKTPEIKPCKCLTISQILLHIEKREMFVDKLQRCKMSERSAIIDSINYHNTFLDSTGNAIEY